MKWAAGAAQDMICDNPWCTTDAALNHLSAPIFAVNKADRPFDPLRFEEWIEVPPIWHCQKSAWWSYCDHIGTLPMLLLPRSSAETNIIVAQTEPGWWPAKEHLQGEGTLVDALDLDLRSGSLFLKLDIAGHILTSHFSCNFASFYMCDVWFALMFCHLQHDVLSCPVTWTSWPLAAEARNSTSCDFPTLRLQEGSCPHVSPLLVALDSICQVTPSDAFCIILYSIHSHPTINWKLKSVEQDVDMWCRFENCSTSRTNPFETVPAGGCGGKEKCLDSL